MPAFPLRRLVTCFLVFVAAIFTIGDANGQDISDSQKKAVKQIKSMIDEAGSLFKAKKFEESAEQIRQAQSKLVKFTSDADAKIVKKLKKDYDRLAKAQSLLKGKGESFDSLPSFDSLMSQSDGTEGSSSKGSDSKGSESKGSDSKGSDSKGSGTKGSSTKEEMEGSGTKEEPEMVSFVSEVAPILIENCGQCHIQQARGQYKMNNYTSIKKGSRKGIAVSPRNLEKSRLIQLIESGKMPPRKSGKKVSSEDLAILKTWVEQGAKFDGDSKQKKKDLNSYVGTQGSSTKDGSEGSGSKGSGSKGSDSKGSSSKDGMGVSSGGSDKKN